MSSVGATRPTGKPRRRLAEAGIAYLVQRTRNIVAPWLAHALMVAATIAVGAMTLVQFGT